MTLVELVSIVERMKTKAFCAGLNINGVLIGDDVLKECEDFLLNSQPKIKPPCEWTVCGLPIIPNHVNHRQIRLTFEDFSCDDPTFFDPRFVPCSHCWNGRKVGSDVCTYRFSPFYGLKIKDGRGCRFGKDRKPL